MDLHLARLHETVTWGSATALERLDSLTEQMQGLGSDAGAAALKVLSKMVRTEALVMAFADTFLILT